MPRLDCRLGTEAENDAIRVAGAAAVAGADVVDKVEVGAVRRGAEPPDGRSSIRNTWLLDTGCVIGKQSRIDNAGALLVCAEPNLTIRRNPNSVSRGKCARRTNIVIRLFDFFDAVPNSAVNTGVDDIAEIAPHIRINPSTSRDIRRVHIMRTLESLAKPCDFRISSTVSELVSVNGGDLHEHRHAIDFYKLCIADAVLRCVVPVRLSSKNISPAIRNGFKIGRASCRERV